MSLTRARLRFSISAVHVSLNPTVFIHFSFPLYSPPTLFSSSIYILILFYHTHSLSNPQIKSSFSFLVFFSSSIMLLPAPSAFSVVNSRGENVVPLFSSSYSSILKLSPARNGVGLVISASKGGSNTRPLTGVIFEPFEEVKKELSLIPTAPQISLARQKYSDACEAAINEQIKWVWFCFWDGFVRVVSLDGIVFTYLVGFLWFLFCFWKGSLCGDDLLFMRFVCLVL